MDSIVAAVQRFGGVIAAPRRTVAALGPEVGQHDGTVLGVLYLLAVGSYGIIEAIAGIVATRDLNAFIMLASTLGRVLVVPIVVLVAAETMLGGPRRYRRGLSLVPLLAVAVIAHELVALGIRVPPYGAEIVGAALSLALVGYIRGVVTPVKDGDTP